MIPEKGREGEGSSLVTTLCRMGKARRKWWFKDGRNGVAFWIKTSYIEGGERQVSPSILLVAS